MSLLRCRTILPNGEQCEFSALDGSDGLCRGCLDAALEAKRPQLELVASNAIPVSTPAAVIDRDDYGHPRIAPRHPGNLGSNGLLASIPGLSEAVASHGPKSGSVSCVCGHLPSHHCWEPLSGTEKCIVQQCDCIRFHKAPPTSNQSLTPTALLPPPAPPATLPTHWPVSIDGITFGEAIEAVALVRAIGLDRARQIAKGQP